MKRYIVPMIITGLLLMLGSCEVLDVKPQQSIPAEDAISDRQGLDKALLGCYDALQSSSYYGRNYIVNADLAADLGEAAGTIKEYYDINNNAILSDNALVEGLWASIYDGINRVNNVIYFLPGVSDIDDEQRSDYLGQLRFLRGLMYFDLVRLFGGVPLRELPALDAGPSLDVPRSTVDDTYDFIIEDLSFAGEHITNTVPGLATADAATALLARVYLYRKDFTAAKSMAGEIIGDGSYSLVADFNDLFDPSANSESVFEVSFSEQDGTRLAEYFFPTSLGGRREIAPTSELIDSFDPADERLNVTLRGLDADPYGYKYRDISTRSDRVYVIRLAELYLIRAEAEAMETGNLELAAGDLNMVRERAGLDPLSFDTLEEFLLALEDERKWELVFEGHRWFDLVRTGRAIDVIPTVTQEYQTLYPIPLTEILTNEAIDASDQNPGY